MLKGNINNPRISVITVCYNAVSTIENTILSVVNQTYDNIEYIVIDGGSTDGTIDLIQKYKNNINYWVSEPDKGIYDAMNKATKVASGDFLFFLNSDDLLYNNEVLSEFATLMSSDDTIYYGDVMQVPGGKTYGGAFSKWRLSYTNICHQAIFYPSKVFAYYSYNTRYKIYADWYLNILCFANKDLQFKYINKLVARYSLGGLSNVLPKDNNFFNDFYGIIAKQFGLFYCLARLYVSLKVFLVTLAKRIGKNGEV